MVYDLGCPNSGASTCFLGPTSGPFWVYIAFPLRNIPQTLAPKAQNFTQEAHCSPRSQRVIAINSPTRMKSPHLGFRLKEDPWDHGGHKAS